MAKYRQLHTEFWTDGFVLELTPEEKYFYLYIMTNPKTSQCGIYELPKRIIETETGYNRETVDKLLKRFEEYNKILYCEATRELMILNWLKYNEPNNMNAIKCINKELKEIKNDDYLKIFYDQCQLLGYRVNEIFKGFSRGFEGATKGLTTGYQEDSKPLPSKEVRSKKQEVINKKEEVIEEVKTETAATKTFNDVVNVFNNNIHPITPIEYEKLDSWAKDVECEVIIMAIEEAVNYNARTIGYITKILNNWLNNNFTTAEAVKAYQRDWIEKKKTNARNNTNEEGEGTGTWDHMKKFS